MTKKPNKTISLLLAVGLAGILSSGTTQVLAAIPTINPTIIATASQPAPNKDIFEIILSDGTSILTTKKDVPSYISNQDNICINGTCYSTNNDSLMHIEANYLYKNITRTIHYFVTPEEYILNYNEILNREPGLTNHKAKLVEAKPITELYELLGVDHPNSNKVLK